jgi:hypothetical protein
MKSFFFHPYSGGGRTESCGLGTSVDESSCSSSGIRIGFSETSYSSISTKLAHFPIISI